MWKQSKIHADPFLHYRVIKIDKCARLFVNYRLSMFYYFYLNFFLYYLFYIIAVEQVVACVLVTQRARVRSPVGTGYLGEVFFGVFPHL